MIRIIKELVAAKADTAIDLAKKIWSYAELAYEETQSAAALIEALEQEGFTIEKGIAGIPTAFTAVFKSGSGKPVVGFLAEYDALARLSQKAAWPIRQAIKEGGAGHGCGHNLLGAGCFAAAAALKDYLVRERKDGTVIFFGCPAEEGAGAKQFIARAGYFDNVDFAYTWHPETVNEVGSRGSVAIMGANFIFDGVAAHAGGEPHLGRSALGALVDRCLRELGAPDWSEADYALAAEFLRTYPRTTMAGIREKLLAYFTPEELDEALARPLDSVIHPFDPRETGYSSGSTDVGDVGYATPTVMLHMAAACLGNVGHSWQNAALACSSIGMKGMLRAAEVMTLAAVRTMEQPELIRKARAELKQKNGGSYQCPLPDYVTPPIGRY